MTLDPFYPIVDRTAWLHRLLPVGIRLVQLRIKELEGAALRQELVRGRDLCREAGCQLIVNDHWREAIDLGCDFVHLGQEDLAEADIPAIKRAGIRFGLSTHDHEELDRALSHAPDYVTLGPIYPTILKAMRFAPQGLERIGEWKRLVGETPLVAIGGFMVERAAGAFEAGADSVSVVTDITLHTDPEARTRAWIEETAPFRR
ncbi:MAG: thiamine phosphate synthase [Pseudomonadota bacterium]